MNVPASAVIRAVNDPDKRGWAPDDRYRVVSVLAPRFIRLAFASGALVAIGVTRQGNSRCTVNAEISRLPDGSDEQSERERWQFALAALADQLDGSWG
jgi:hypothetical protein